MKTAALIAVLSLFSVQAQAAEPTDTCAPEVTLRRVPMQHQGKPGIWFDARVARCMAADLKMIGEYKLLTRDYELRLGRAEDYTTNLERRLELSILEASKANEIIETAVRGRREAEEELGKPGRSRALWFGVGVGTGIVLVAVSAYALSRVR